MPRYTIRPRRSLLNPVRLGALDASHVFGVVEKMGCGEADVLEGEAYSFSLRLDPHGVWSIFRRQDALASSAAAPEEAAEGNHTRPRLRA